jgi:DNA-binding GntR family transcriptional regulator
MDSADADHKELFGYIERQELKGAKRVLSRHILRVKDHVLKGVRQMIEATQM